MANAATCRLSWCHLPSCGPAVCRLCWYRSSGSYPRGAYPRLSVAVLPFENLGGDANDDRLAGGITEDLTTDLSHIAGAFIAAREFAYSYKSKADDVRRIGEALGVRYVVNGSLQRLGPTLRVNAQLTSTETGAQLWSYRFDEAITERSTGQEQIVTRMKDELARSMVEIETLRSLRERPTNPDAFDLVLRARSLRYLPPSPQRDGEITALLEQAFAKDPTSLYAMTGIAYYLTDAAGVFGWGSFDNMQRAGRLLNAGALGRTRFRNGTQHLRLLASHRSRLSGSDRAEPAGYPN